MQRRFAALAILCLSLAAGAAWAARYSGDDMVSLAYLGDGATSEGDFHAAMNFAGVWKAPVVFVCQNNQFAISVPLSAQTTSPTLAVKAIGYGMPGVQVDGNDVLAVHSVTGALLDDARAGQGPALIEALTYRVGAHTTADDPTRYRSEQELAEWTARDPILRMRRHLATRGVGAEVFEGIDAEAADLAADVRRRVLEIEDPPASLMFEHVYHEPHPIVEAQRAWQSEYEASYGEQS